MSITNNQNMSAAGTQMPGALDSRIFLLPQGNHLRSLMTILRDSNTNVATFAEVTERVGDQLISAGMYLMRTSQLK